MHIDGSVYPDLPEPLGDLPEVVLAKLADELFQSYDAGESAGATDAPAQT